jgi:hypothetical protein
MKRTIITLTVVIAAFVLGIVLGASKAQTYNSSVAIAAPAPVPMAVPMPANCPNIHAAADALRSAEQEMRDARHDFCGHKQSAMEAVHHAIEELHGAENCQRCR